VLAAACVVAAGCSLGLDESLISASDAGADGAPVQVDGSAPRTDSGGGVLDAGSDAGLAVACTKDTDCVSNQACLTGRCDTSRGACVYDVCPTKGTICSSSVCTSGKCGAPVVQKFAGAKIAVPSGLSCGNIQRCIAAVHPWVFLGTNSGVLAYPAVPADPNPTPITVGDIPFIPQSMVASGNRIYVLGGLVSAGTTKVQIAWFDAPIDPLQKSISAQSALLPTNRASGDLILSLPALSALLTQQGAPNPLFAGALSAPVSAASSITQYDTDAGPLQSQVAGTSGSRLAMFKTNGVNSNIQLLSNVGTATQAFGAPIDTTAALPGGVAGASFTGGPDGSLRIHYYTASSVGQVTTYKTHVAELLENGTATTLSTKFPPVDVDTYTTPLGGAFLGNVAWVDTSSILAASSTPPMSTATSSHVQWVDNKKSAPKALALATTPYTSVVVAGSAGIGWAATNDSPTAASLYYLSPACAQ
jgi:hypothetical protein